MSWNKDNLKKAFEKAGLDLEFAKQSFATGGRNSEDIFGLDIRRKEPGKPHSEYFLMWPGHEDNSITIRDTDKSFSQIILTINEEEREFEQTISEFEVRNVKNRGEDVVKAFTSRTVRGYPKVKVYHPKKNHLVLLQRTPKDSRTFLIGKDERQLFMTQVNRNITSVKAAHDSLKTPTVTFFEGQAPGKTIRQGEWFFVNLPSKELEDLETAIKKHFVSPLKKAPIGNFAGRSGGKPHTADELVVWNGVVSKRLTFEEQRKLRELAEHNNINGVRRMMTESPSMGHRNEVYVRGAVKHLDHETVKFSNWRKVIANTESRTSSAVGSAVGGGTWID